MIRQTSLSAYRDIQFDGTENTQISIIYREITKYNGITRNELSRKLGITINAVCGRVNKLIEVGLVFEEGKRADKVTGKQNYIIKAYEVKTV